PRALSPPLFHGRRTALLLRDRRPQERRHTSGFSSAVRLIARDGGASLRCRRGPRERRGEPDQARAATRARKRAGSAIARRHSTAARFATAPPTIGAV